MLISGARWNQRVELTFVSLSLHLPLVTYSSNLWLLSNESNVMTDRQSAILCYCQALIWDLQQIFRFIYLETVVSLVMWVTHSDERACLYLSVFAGTHQCSLSV
jgi:hypothetical protein